MLLCAEASQACYDSGPYNLAWFRNRAFNNYDAPSGWDVSKCSDGRTDGFAMAFVLQGRLYIVFRGTHSTANFIQDADIAMRPLFMTAQETGVAVHHGFQRDFESLWPCIRGVVRQYLSMISRIRQPEIIITGHSLGAAEAALCAVYLWHVFGIKPSGYTFGQPRVGNKQWSKLFNESVSNWWRVVDCNDIVPRLPWLLHSYRHTGPDIFLDAKGGPHYSLPWWKKIYYDLKGLFRHKILQVEEILKDHAIERYRQSVNGIVLDLEGPIIQRDTTGEK